MDNKPSSMGKGLKVLVVFVCCLFSLNILFADKVLQNFTTSDGQHLIMKTHVGNKGNPGVVMLHGLSAAKEEWEPFMQKLKQEGWSYLAYDARGHGASSKTQDAGGHPNGFQAFGRPGPGTEWEKMIGDEDAAVQTLKKIVGAKTPIFLAGASIGANISLIYASKHPELKGLILLSPGVNYQEFQTEQPMTKLKQMPVVIVASASDRYAHNSSILLKSKSDQAILWDDVKPGHGVQMLDASLMDRLFKWLVSHK